MEVQPFVFSLGDFKGWVSSDQMEQAEGAVRRIRAVFGDRLYWFSDREKRVAEPLAAAVVPQPEDHEHHQDLPLTLVGPESVVDRGTMTFGYRRQGGDFERTLFDFSNAICCVGLPEPNGDKETGSRRFADIEVGKGGFLSTRVAWVDFQQGSRTDSDRYSLVAATVDGIIAPPGVYQPDSAVVLVDLVGFVSGSSAVAGILFVKKNDPFETETNLHR